jgi:hypothetical protein
MTSSTASQTSPCPALSEGFCIAHGRMGAGLMHCRQRFQCTPFWSDSTTPALIGPQAKWNIRRGEANADCPIDFHETPVNRGRAKQQPDAKAAAGKRGGRPSGQDQFQRMPEDRQTYRPLQAQCHEWFHANLHLRVRGHSALQGAAKGGNASSNRRASDGAAMEGVQIVQVK